MQPHDHSIGDDELPIGHLLAKRYEIRTFIGAGAIGSVYAAFDRMLESTIALKVLHGEYARDSRVSQQFLQEVKLMNRVNHQNVVRTYDVGNDGTHIYYTMEHIDGVVLESYLECVESHPSILARLTVQLCRGLEAIHAVQVVHRDLKPTNVIVSSSGCVKITDIGVARTTNSNLTTHREVMGSLEYIAPEILVGAPVTFAADFYSLGMLLYHSVIGKPPFQSDDLAELIGMHINEVPPPPKTIDPLVPAWLNDLIMQLIRKEPQLRPQSAEEIIEQLRPHLTEDVCWSASDDSGSSIFFSMRASRSTEPLPELFETGDSLEPLTDTGPLVTTRDACDGIIFDALPTLEEIIEHENKFGTGNIRRVRPLQGEPIVEEQQITEIKKLRRSVYLLCLLVMAGLIMMLQFLYNRYGSSYHFSVSGFSASTLPTADVGDALQEVVAEAIPEIDFGASSELLAALDTKLRGEAPSPQPVMLPRAAEPEQPSAPEGRPLLEVVLGRAGEVKPPAPAAQRAAFEPGLAPSAFSSEALASKLASAKQRLSRLFAGGGSERESGRAQSHARLAEIDEQLATLTAIEAGTIAERVDALRVQLRDLRAALNEVRSGVQDDAKKVQYWSRLANSLDEQDIVSLTLQMEGASAEVSEQRKAYEQASSRYFEVVEAAAQGKQTDVNQAGTTREEAGSRLEQERVKLRATAGEVIRQSLAAVIEAGAQRKAALQTLEDEEKRLLATLRMLQSPAASVPGGPTKDELMAEKKALERSLKGRSK